MSRAPDRVRPRGRDAAPGPVPGDCWQGEAFNALIPALERAGYRVVPGTLDHDGVSVRSASGARARLTLVSPGTATARVEDDEAPGDEAPSDQFPAVAMAGGGGGALVGLYRGDAAGRHPDLDAIDRIVSRRR